MSSKSFQWTPTARDLDILNALWDSPESMTASEIVHAVPGLTINTVQVVLRKLLKNDVIQVAKIVYSGTVLCRSYQPTMSRNDFMTAKLAKEIAETKADLSKTSLVAALFEKETNPQKAKREIEELEKMLEEFKKTL